MPGLIAAHSSEARTLVPSREHTSREVTVPMTDLLTMMATPAWAYLALYGLLAVDAMVPVVPIQAIMITSGALTVYGGLSLPARHRRRRTGHVHRRPGVLRARPHRRSRHRPRPQRPTGRPAAALCPRRQHAADARPPGTERTTAKRAAARFTRGLRRPGPLVLLLCRFVPGGRMAAGYNAGRTGYPIRLFVTYDGVAAVCLGDVRRPGRAHRRHRPDPVGVAAVRRRRHRRGHLRHRRVGARPLRRPPRRHPRGGRSGRPELVDPGTGLMAPPDRYDAPAEHQPSGGKRR